ncbi:MAG: hypothetical protein P8012_01800 [Desulfobacterales bacterium]
MNGNLLKTVVLISLILLFIFSLSACKTVKGSIGFKWGQGPGNGHFREVKNVQKESLPVADIEQNRTLGNGSAIATTGSCNCPA